MEIGNFFVVATPIGNMKDITLRALETLASVDFVACEDTRVTKKLLDRHGICANLFDYHKFNEKACSEKILSLLKKGKSVALVSDAGTPGISDPGCVLFEELIKNNIKINVIPGACAVSTFLSALGRDDEFFAFGGFLPRKQNQQEELFSKYKNINFIFYESPNRLLDSLNNIANFRGENTKIAIGRELTKVYEEILTDSVANVIKHYESNVLKGEIVAMVYCEKELEQEAYDYLKEIRTLKSQGFSDKDISKIISSLYGANKNKIYKTSIEL